MLLHMSHMQLYVLYERCFIGSELRHYADADAICYCLFTLLLIYEAAESHERRATLSEYDERATRYAAARADTCCLCR